MKIRQQHNPGPKAIILAAGTQEEAAKLFDFAKHKEPLVAHIEFNRHYQYPYIIIRKERT